MPAKSISDSFFPSSVLSFIHPSIAKSGYSPINDLTPPMKFNYFLLKSFLKFKHERLQNGRGSKGVIAFWNRKTIPLLLWFGDGIPGISLG